MRIVKIKMKTTAASPEYNYPAGSVQSTDIETAEAFVKGGYAEYVGKKPMITTEIPESTEDIAVVERETAALETAGRFPRRGRKKLQSKGGRK